VSGSTPTVVGDLLIVGFYGHVVFIGLKRTSGELVWNNHFGSSSCNTHHHVWDILQRVSLAFFP